jgi:hypothetical protein
MQGEQRLGRPHGVGWRKEQRHRTCQRAREGSSHLCNRHTQRTPRQWRSLDSSCRGTARSSHSPVGLHPRPHPWHEAGPPAAPQPPASRPLSGPSRHPAAAILPQLPRISPQPPHSRPTAADARGGTKLPTRSSPPHCARFPRTQFAAVEPGRVQSSLAPIPGPVRSSTVCTLP